MAISAEGGKRDRSRARSARQTEVDARAQVQPGVVPRAEDGLTRHAEHDSAARVEDGLTPHAEHDTAARAEDGATRHTEAEAMAQPEVVPRADDGLRQANSDLVPRAEDGAARHTEVDARAQVQPGVVPRAEDGLRRQAEHDTAARAEDGETRQAEPRGIVRTERRSGRVGRWREILYMLVLRDLQARSKQAYLGYLWILIQPLLLTGVFSVLVQQVLGRGDLADIPYPVFLMAGVIPWQFFANSLNESTDSLVKNVDLVRQVYFPREILAIYPVFARLIDVAIGCLALGVFMLVWHVAVSAWVVLVPLILVEEMLFAMTFGLLLSAANVAWRDVSRGLPLVLFLMLYAVPVLYAPDRIPGALRPLFELNPIARLVDAFRTSIVGSQPPDLAALALLGVLGIVALILAQRLFAVFDGVLADVV
jgi:lipopolysaccharide transport system permease protein